MRLGKSIIYPLYMFLLGCDSSHEVVDNPQAETWFEEADHSGILFRHDSGATGNFMMPEIMGGGVALFDVDGDQDLDLYFIQGGGGLSETGEQPIGNELYLNRGDGSFVKAIDSGSEDTGYGMGVAVGDYDRDGDTDIYVTNVGPNVLLRNDGTGRFENVSRQAGVDDSGWGTASAFTDFDKDGDLDLFVVNYIVWGRHGEPDCFIDGVRTYCAPEHFDAPAPDRFFRNNGDGTFTDISEHIGLNYVFGNGLGLVTRDFDTDGWIDIFVANDMNSNQLWINRGDLQFNESALRKGVAADGHGNIKAGMGVASDDIDGDNDPDLLVVNLETQADSFFRNEVHYFTDVTAEIGLAVNPRRTTRFGVVLADFDNDGYLDIYEGNGRINPGDYLPDVFAEPNSLYRGSDFSFQEVIPRGGVAVELIHTSRGVAVGDIDNDGGLDLVVVNRDAAPYVLLNRIGNQGNWIRFSLFEANGLAARGANISALVGDRRINRYQQVEGSYLASSDPRIHFGLNDQLEITDVIVQWSDGIRENFGSFKAGKEIILTRSDSVVNSELEQK